MRGKKVISKLLAGVLAAVMTFTSVPFSVLAEDGISETEKEDDTAEGKEYENEISNNADLAEDAQTNTTIEENYKDIYTEDLDIEKEQKLEITGESEVSEEVDLNTSGVVLSKAEMNLRVGEKQSLTATVTMDENYYDGVEWKVSDAKVAIIEIIDNKTVNVIAKNPGEAVISVITQSGYLTDECYVTVTGDNLGSDEKLTYSLLYKVQRHGYNGGLITGASITGYEGIADGDLIIPSSVDGYQILSIDDYAFKDATFNGKLILEEGIIGIGSGAFLNCKMNGELILPESIAWIGASAFSGCSGFTGNVIIPAGVNSMRGSVFSGCSGLESVTLPESMTAIEAGTFSNCSSLTQIGFPSGITTIGNSAFLGCNNIDGEFIIPSTVTDIGEKAFYECAGITKLFISGNVQNIGEDAFSNCAELHNIIFRGNKPIFNDPSRLNYTIANNVTATLYYPKANITWDNVSDYEKKGIGTKITWASYEEGSEPWNMLFSDGMPCIFSAMDTNSLNLTYNDLEYYPSSFEVNLIMYYMQFDNPTTYENVKITIELSDGLSFEEDNVQKILTKQIDIMDSTEEKRKVVLEPIKLYTDGHYETDEFQIIVSVTADGYETAAKTTLKIPVEKEINYDFYDIQVYSEFANIFVGENQTCAILPAMVNGDEALKNEEGWNFSIENTDIAEIKEYVETEFGPAARIVGKSAGNTKLHIIHIPTGKSVTLTIGVGKNTLTYDLSDVVHFSENEGIMNYGIFTNNYTSQKVADGYLVTFDAYNECSSAGAVEVYDSEGNMKYAYEIKKFDRYQTGVKEVFMDGWNLACSAVNGTIMNITNSMYTKRTSISATVPQGGYIIITNDVTNSVPALVYNTVDVTSWMYKEAKAFTKWEKEEPFKDKAKGKFCDEIISYFLQQKYEDKIWMQFQDKLTKSLKKSASMSIEDGCNLVLGLYNNTEAAMHDIDIDMKEEIKDAAIDTGIDVAMDVFNEFSPTGEILETMFGINEALNGMMQVVDINKTIGGTKIRIDVAADNGKLVSEGVIVESEDGTIPDGTDLVVVDITAEETSRYIIENLINASQVKIYNITLYKDKTEIQPNGKIRVKVPLPALYKENQCVIYRVESDGSFTDMGAQYSDGYMLFETEHLSNYILYEKVMYSVSFDGNGASDGNMEMLSNCIEGEEYVLPANGYQREGYLFKEWNTAIDGTGMSYADKATIKNLAKSDGEDIILYAQWTLPPKEDVDIGDVRVEDIPEDGIIPQGLWISNITEQTYTGNAIKPVVRVYDYKTLLKEKKDYVISYKNNKKVNDAKVAKIAPTIIVTGKGNYSGKETQTFVISPKDITEEDVMASEIALKSNGKVQKPVPIVMWNGKKLTNKRDFVVSYPDVGNGAYKENGTYKVVLNGTGNYAGSREVMLTITSSKLIPKLKIDKIADQPYTGNKITPKPVVKDGKNVLTENVHYTVDYKNNTEIGTATVIITGMGEYVGVKQTTFKIKAVASLNKAKVILTTNSGSNFAGSIYTGKAIKPDGFILTITVKNNEKQNTVITLKEGTDYKVSYQNNIDAGTATILFTGINKYTGIIKKKYKITAYDIKADDKNIKISLKNSYSYTKGGCKPKPIVTFAGTELEEGIDYTLSYKNNSTVNNGSNQSKMPTVIIKGKGNFKGSLTKTYLISNAKIDNLVLTATDKVWQNKANIYKTKITINDVDGKALSAGKDYDKNIVYTYDATTTLADGTVKKAGTIVDAKDIIPADTVIRVTASANKNGNYHGTVSGTFRITKADISKATVKIPAQTYTGKAIEPDDKIEIKLNKKSLSKENYEIVGYSNNINKGTATVTIKGKNDCGGTKTVKFKIKQKGFLWWWRR